MARIDDLKAKRDFMWDSMTEADADKRAPLMNQWRALDATIAELENKAVKVGDPVDEIAARRVARGGATARPRRSSNDQG